MTDKINKTLKYIGEWQKKDYTKLTKKDFAKDYTKFTEDFEYFVEKLRRQHKVFCTSRKYQQVNGIEKFGSLNSVIVGKHGGKNNVNKLLASLDRSKLLTKKIEKYSPNLLISFCSP